jgi:hypothetical protein
MTLKKSACINNLYLSSLIRDARPYLPVLDRLNRAPIVTLQRSTPGSFIIMGGRSGPEKAVNLSFGMSVLERKASSPCRFPQLASKPYFANISPNSRGSPKWLKRLPQKCLWDGPTKVYYGVISATQLTDEALHRHHLFHLVFLLRRA